MDEEALNTNVLKFLKKLGVTAQREIEKVVRDADAQGHLKSGERLLASRRHSGRYRPQIRNRRRYRAGVRLGPLADPRARPRVRCPPKAKVTRSNRVGCARFQCLASYVNPKLCRGSGTEASETRSTAAARVD
jgi:uncharacterized protein DUF6494